MEYFDILDKDGNKTGEKMLRRDVHATGGWHRSVHVWIINNEKELLIQKRAPKKDSHPNMWDISVAGHIPAGKSSELTVKQEAKEELGINLSNEDFKLLFTYKNRSVQQCGAFINNEYSDVYLVHKDIDINKVKLQEEEVSEIKWIKWQELERIIKAKDREFIIHREEYKRLFSYLKDNI